MVLVCFFGFFFHPQLNGFYALRLSWAGSGSPKQEVEAAGGVRGSGQRDVLPIPGAF